jgi:hypothetical protein
MGKAAGSFGSGAKLNIPVALFVLHDFWFMLGMLYIVMVLAAIVDHKL